MPSDARTARAGEAGKFLGIVIRGILAAVAGATLNVRQKPQRNPCGKKSKHLSRKNFALLLAGCSTGVGPAAVPRTPVCPGAGVPGVSRLSAAPPPPVPQPAFCAKPMCRAALADLPGWTMTT